MGITDADGVGALFIAPDKMAASVAHWRASDMYVNRNNRVKHPYQMSFRKNTVVCLDARNRALGNASCGPDVRDMYELKAENTIFNFIISPIAGKSSNDRLSEQGRISSPVCSPVKIERDAKGNVILSTATEGATIYYRVNDGEFRQYKEPVNMAQGGTVTAYCNRAGYFESMQTSMEINLFVDKSQWKVIGCSSQQGGGEKVENAIDGDESTIWHTQYGNNEPSHPHEIVVDMGQTYRVDEFIYQGRKDGSNGRIKEYEVYFSNSPAVWGAPAATGVFSDTPDPQHVKITSKPAARYFKLIAKSEVNNRAWAAVAELGIEASAIVDPEEVTCDNLTSGQKYYIKDVASGLYLQWKHDTGSNYEGEFCINPLNRNDETFMFTFSKVNGFTSFYTILVDGKYMNKGEGSWRCGIGSVTDNKDGWIQLETQDDCTQKMRGMWQTSKYFNLDRHTAGSYIYADKADGALFALERFNEVSIIPVDDVSGVSVYPAITDGEIVVRTSGKAAIKVMNMGGATLADYRSEGELTIGMNYANGMYLVGVETENLPRMATYKIMLYR